MTLSFLFFKEYGTLFCKPHPNICVYIYINIHTKNVTIMVDMIYTNIYDIYILCKYIRIYDIYIYDICDMYDTCNINIYIYDISDTYIIYMVHMIYIYI